MVLLMLTHNAQAQPLTVDPESIVPLPEKFDMETPAPDVPPEIARFQGAWIGTWHERRSSNAACVQIRTSSSRPRLSSSVLASPAESIASLAYCQN